MKLKILVLLISLLGHGLLVAQKSKVVGNITMRIKSYEQGLRENETGIAANATLKVVNIETGDEVSMKSKYGMFKTQLAIGQNYLVQISKPGFESKSIIVTTRGADPGYRYILRFDFYLQLSGYAEYSHQRPVKCIIHNRAHHRFDLKDCAYKIKGS